MQLSIDFFLVPDYQREYVWKPDDEVEQFLIDIENEYSPDAKEQRNYFLGSIIIVNNDRCFDVVDGQQRLTTIMLSLCVFRDLLKKETLNSAQKNYLQIIENLLSLYLHYKPFSQQKNLHPKLHSAPFVFDLLAQNHSWIAKWLCQK